MTNERPCQLCDRSAKNGFQLCEECREYIRQALQDCQAYDELNAALSYAPEDLTIKDPE